MPSEIYTAGFTLGEEPFYCNIRLGGVTKISGVYGDYPNVSATYSSTTVDVECTNVWMWGGAFMVNIQLTDTSGKDTSLRVDFNFILT